MLGFIYSEFQQRKCAELNIINHSAAISAAIALTPPGEKIQSFSDLLPYSLDADKPRINKAVVEKLYELAARNELPPRMLQDLYRNKIIEPR